MPTQEIIHAKNGSRIGIWKVKESVEELEKMLPELSQSDVYQGFNHNLRRLEWLGARALMKVMKLDTALSYSEHGKPFYPNGPKISLTHSKDYICIITHPTKEVGIDVQEIVPKVERIKHKFCNAYELDWATTTEDFTLIWSAKEAMFKIKEHNVHFGRDIKVHQPKNSEEFEVEFKESEKYTARIMTLEGYSGVFMV